MKDLIKVSPLKITVFHITNKQHALSNFTFKAIVDMRFKILAIGNLFYDKGHFVEQYVWIYSIFSLPLCDQKRQMRQK